MSPHSEVPYSSDEDGAPQLVTGNGNGTYTNGEHTNGNGTGNGVASSNGHAQLGQKLQHIPKQKSQHLQPSSFDSTDDFDLICVGFGPASLAVAVAMHDAIASGRNLLPNGTTTQQPPKVLFIEKQTRFAWHAGMLLPGAKMQISFIKDLATLRDPRSEFTFLNYLHSQGRLVDFTNLDTFLPARVEYEDYMRWAASAFEQVVQYGHQVVSVSPDSKTGGAAKGFTVQARNVETGEIRSCHGRNVLVAAGGQPALPTSLPAKHPRVIHSSQYAQLVPKILTKKDAPYRVTVIGAGQSAAEIFSNIHTLYPNSQTRLIMRPEFLRPSDDSPFVNSVFNPEYVDMLYPKSSAYRNNFIAEARATNYGVVRLELIEHLYERMYEQRRELGPDDTHWPHRIMGGRKLTSVQPSGDETVSLRAARVEFDEDDEFALGGLGAEDAWEADLVIAATGYRRDAHVEMLRDTWDLLPKAAAGGKRFEKGITGWHVQTPEGEHKMAVGRDYQVQYRPGTVESGSGVWLQGCCEGTHGLSDTLLSVLATRSGEIVDSIFGGESSRKN